MVGSIETMESPDNGYSTEQSQRRLAQNRRRRCHGSVFAALLQDSYRQFRNKIQIRIWRRAVDWSTAEHLFEVINSWEDVLRRLIRRCAYLKYVEAPRTLYADEILINVFCLVVPDESGDEGGLGCRPCGERSPVDGC
ncbi:unnamed protein product [Linum trigynum]|uniref:Transposase n=1 Tax=Linum trigynum TaxID=586398 RepID=A0AAV2DCN9_9ROSI